MASSSCRPRTSMRALHQAAPPVETIVTRSPSAAPFCRNSATAALACRAWKGVRCTSSKTITKVRPAFGVAAGPVLVETGGGADSAAGVAGASWTASKVATLCGAPSSSTLKSDLLRPVTGTPCLSVTTTSTTTCSTSDVKVGSGGAEGTGWGAGDTCADTRPASSNPQVRSALVRVMVLACRGAASPVRRPQRSILANAAPNVQRRGGVCALPRRRLRRDAPVPGAGPQVVDPAPPPRRHGTRQCGSPGGARCWRARWSRPWWRWSAWRSA